ncbi:MAG: AsmA family protein [Rhodospirillales bacterium]|nr:AsmA family protein [Rhodospirillales bacterium]
MKLLFRLLLGLAAVVVAVAVTAAAIIMTTDTRQIAGIISERVKAATGRELVIAGDMEMRLSLVPTLSATDVRFGNASWGSRPDMVRLDRVEVGLALVPLLNGNIRLSQLTLIGPDILLEVSPEGTPNWRISVDPRTARQAREIEQEAERIYGLPVLESLAIERASVRYLDPGRKLDRRLSLTRLDLLNQSGAERMRLDIAGSAAGHPFTVGGSITSLYRLIEDPRFFILDLLVTGLGASGEAKGVIAAPLTDRELDIRISFHGNDLPDTYKQVTALAPSLPKFDIPAIKPYEIAFRLAGTPASLAAEGIEFQAGEKGGLAVALNGSASGITGNKPKWSFSARVEAPDPSILSGLAGFRLPSEPGIRIEAVVSNPDDELAFSNVSLRLGDTGLNGNAVLELGNAPPKITAALKADRLPVDRLMAFLPDREEKQERGKARDGRIIPMIELARPRLPELDATLRMVVGEVVFSGLSIRQLAASVKATSRDIDIALARARFGGGTWSGRLGASLDGGMPEIAGELDLKNGRIETLLAYATGHELADGPLDAKFTFTGRGADLRSLAAGLNGDVEVVMSGGGVANRYVDLLAVDLIREIVPWVHETKEARINCFVSRFHVREGIATSTGLLLDTDKVAIGGGGTINLRDETLHLRINPKPKQESLVSLAFPIDIKGTLANPSAAPTPGAVAKGVAGLALGLVNPLGILLAVASGGDRSNHCMAALESADTPIPETSMPGPGTARPAAKEEGSVVEGVIEGVGEGLGEVGEGIGKGIKGIGKGIGGAIQGIFGGGK